MRFGRRRSASSGEAKLNILHLEQSAGIAWSARSSVSRAHRRSAFSSSESHDIMIGNRPRNSGIMPYFVQDPRYAPSRAGRLYLRSLGPLPGHRSPIAARSPTRRRTMSSRPLNAPQQIKRMSVVSTWISSPAAVGCETHRGNRRVLALKGLSSPAVRPHHQRRASPMGPPPLRAILSISSMQIMPR